MFAKLVSAGTLRIKKIYYKNDTFNISEFYNRWKKTIHLKRLFALNEIHMKKNSLSKQSKHKIYKWNKKLNENTSEFKVLFFITAFVLNLYYIYDPIH